MAHWSLGDLPVHKNWIELGSVVFCARLPMKTIVYPLFKFTFESMMIFRFSPGGIWFLVPQVLKLTVSAMKNCWEKIPRLRVFWGGKKRWFNPWILCQFYRKMEGSWRNLRSGQINNFDMKALKAFWYDLVASLPVASSFLNLMFFFGKMMIFFPFDSLDRIWLVKNQGRRNLLSLPLSFSGCTECVGSLATRRETWGGR